jgi:ATP-dependent DNA ligase
MVTAYRWSRGGRQVRLYSRRGNDWTSRLPILSESLTAIPSPALVLDAELCLPIFVITASIALPQSLLNW